MNCWSISYIVNIIYNGMQWYLKSVYWIWIQKSFQHSSISTLSCFHQFSHCLIDSSSIPKLFVWSLYQYSLLSLFFLWFCGHYNYGSFFYWLGESCVPHLSTVLEIPLFPHLASYIVVVLPSLEQVFQLYTLCNH